MAHVCPWWVGVLLVSPLRRLLEKPEHMLGPFIEPGMRILEPGCGMGFFSLPMARMAGPEGLVVCVEVQEKMLAGLRRRAEKAGLAGRIETRLAGEDGLGVDDLAGSMDLAVAVHLVHEVTDQAGFFAQVAGALRPGGRLVLLEPRGHVSQAAFAASLDQALAAGLDVRSRGDLGRLSALLAKPAA